MEKKVLFFTFLSFMVSCSTVHNKYFKMVEGEWQITTFYHGNKDLWTEGYYSIGFQDTKKSWMIKAENGEKNQFVLYDYKFYMNVDTLKIDVFNSKDPRLNANYNIYIDTIQETEESYTLQLTLDTEKTYIQAIKTKFKYHYPPGWKGDTPRRKAKE
ncbi:MULTISPECIES: hypothetical protein [Flavobacterium]|uniref:Lipocalin-like domain-containing protein n=1 Tax=Flavobacterium jumunjinense TaxID=998845 RepID=A0ABV5GQD3_9FLAO|nr:MULTISPECIES: hypothetical protein [Flavobacterium]